MWSGFSSAQFKYKEPHYTNKKYFKFTVFFRILPKITINFGCKGIFWAFRKWLLNLCEVTRA